MLRCAVSNKVEIATLGSSPTDQTKWHRKCDPSHHLPACNAAANPIGVRLLAHHGVPRCNVLYCFSTYCSYVNNPAPSRFFCGYTGYTAVLSARTTLAAYTPYGLNISVTDKGDPNLDTAVLVEAATLVPVQPATFPVQPVQPVQPAYATGEWGLCSVSCGTGFQTRSVLCPSNLCGGLVAPASSQACSMPACVSTFTVCTDLNTLCTTCATPPMNFCSDASSRPYMMQSCPAACGFCAGAVTQMALPTPMPFTFSPFSPAPVPPPVVYQPVYLTAAPFPTPVPVQQVVYQPVYLTSAPLPVTATPENSIPCAQAVLNFLMTAIRPNAWGACSNTCSIGVQTRSLGCLDIVSMYSTVMSSFQGQPIAKLLEMSQSCNAGQCPAPVIRPTLCPDQNTMCPTWTTANPNLCFTDQTIRLSCPGSCNSCVTPTAAPIIPATPVPTPMPAPTVQMSYAWSMGNWGPCSPSCGANGMQTRPVMCLRLLSVGAAAAQSSVADDSFCAGVSPKLPTTQACALTPCPIPSNYVWHTGTW